ncbi:hypothetical protein BACCAP_01835 [Pseudoflavonifractor capillosus ATCC 29799]|uniref:Uncharacterized protein n=1 Tax=Pseudoflavonifractor capillosus ATCC 29799 TaxID=411467 RepID=A6NUF3_9FIRM|nr:hypothetical protein BACCAP_01835 [Pseudoflavonifractor capillosus ATCC 29799]
MDINGWNYLFESLPHWRIRERFPYDRTAGEETGEVSQ